MGLRHNKLIYMKKLAKYTFIVSLVSFVPIIALADSADPCAIGDNPMFGTLVTFIICNISKFVIPLIFSLAMVMFIWGVVRYVINGSDEAK